MRIQNKKYRRFILIKTRTTNKKILILIVQYNCKQGYKSTVIVLETVLSVKAGIVIIQELFIDNQEISYSRFNFYWPQRKRKNIKVMTIVRKNLIDKIMVDHRIDLVNHLYFMLLEIQKLDTQSKRPRRKIWVVNTYDNQIGRSCPWDNKINYVRRPLEDIN